MLAVFGLHRLEKSSLADVLQIAEPSPAVVERFRAWQARTLDIPGRYYGQVVEDLFRRNALARGEFRALGRRLDLRSVRSPVFLIASDRDEVTAPEQLMAVRRLVGTDPARIAAVTVTGPHLSLFMGRHTLGTAWRDAARWIGSVSAG
jgi:poly(3-hydroxyalkanoate) synthetase